MDLGTSIVVLALLASVLVGATQWISKENLLETWTHALAGFLVVAIAEHIAVSVYLGHVFFR